MTATDADRAKAAEVHIAWLNDQVDTPLSTFIAAALATERAAAVADLRARVLALAEEYEAYVRDRGRPAPGSFDHGLNMAQSAAASDLRAAVTDTTGDPA